MSFPRFKFTLSNTIEGTLEIHEPDGWDDGKLDLERNELYHSLIELYSQPLSFADTVSYDIDTMAELLGGMSWINNIEDTQGLNAIISIQIEISEDDGDTYEDIFNGVLDIPTIKETDFYKLECGVKRDDFWSKFINRKSIPVDLESTTDLDGGTRTAVNKIVLPLPSQKIRGLYDAYLSEFVQLFDDNIPVATNIQVDMNVILKDDLEEVFSLGTGPNAARVVWFFEPEFDGSYDFNLRLESWARDLIGVTTIPSSPYVHWYFQINDDTPILFTETNFGTVPYQSTVYTYIVTQALVATDKIRVYGTVYSSLTPIGGNQTYFIVSTQTALAPSGAGGVASPPTFFQITGDTTYIDTETDAYLLKDAAESILSKITGADSVVQSDYLDSLVTDCDRNYAIMKGLHVRGYSFTEKPFTHSFDSWWDGANPVLNLGLGYGVGDKIVIEEKAFFYDNTPVLNLDFVNNIERSYDLENVYKSLEIGFEKWSAESDSGTDDPQTKRKYETGLATVGTDIRILSKYYAASLGIEQARRNRVEKGKDYRLDEDVMIISVVPDGSDWTPEFKTNFTSVINLLNSDYRYNLRLTPSYNFLRWRNFFNGCLQVPGGTDYKFSYGEGNYEMYSELDGADCEYAGAIDEGGDIPVTSDILCTPKVYTFDHPLTYEQYKTIRDNRNKAIGVSSTDADHVPAHIMSLEYKPTRALATFKVKLGA